MNRNTQPKATQLQPRTGKNRRSQAASFAASNSNSTRDRRIGCRRKRIVLFAQFPPAALFTALGRAVSRRASATAPADGTLLALRTRRRSAGGG